MFDSRSGNAIALALLAFPYCLTAQAQTIPELETQPASLTLPPPSRNNPNLPLAQVEEIPVDEPVKVLPRIGATFQSGPDAGYGTSFGSLYAFVPFSQIYGVSTFYTEGRVNFFTHDGEFGGNLRLGYRTLLPKSNLVLGGYIGADARRTEFDETFYQLGFGVDLQGDRWEISANGYIPIGLREREVVNETFDTGTTISNLAFSGNNLTFSRFRQRTTARLLETSMMGFDLEGGYQIARWETGSVSAYAGAYFLDAPGSSSFIGVRGRVQVEVENFHAGIALQSDGNFGTNLTFNVGATFGGNTTRNKEETPEEGVIARLGREARRQEVIAIDRETEATNTIEQEDNVAAINPDTGEAWRFLHVTGGGSGDCTFESPCGQVTEAMDLAQTAGNDIVYVDSGTNPGMNGFSILDNVQVLSTAYERFIDYQVTGVTETFNSQLPGSGTGVLPLINGTTVTVDGNTAMVSMGNNSILSGFDIQSGNDTGVLGLNVGGWTVERNQVTTTGDNAYGVFASANNGTISSATISGNSVSTSGSNADGIFASANNGTISSATISGNSVSTSGSDADGIFASANNGTISSATMSGNTISTSENYARGIFASVNNGGTINSATMSGNSISTSGSDARGIFAFADNGTIASATISDNSLSTSGDNARGIFAYANNGTISTATMSGNTISTSGNNAYGILARTNNGGTINTATMSGNTISTSESSARGIVVDANNGTISTATMSNNTISTVGDFARGIFVDAGSGGTISSTTMSGNSISTSGSVADGIFVFPNIGTIGSATISGNTISTSENSARGIYVTTFNGATIGSATISGNTISTSGSSAHGIWVFPDSGTISSATISGNTISTSGSSAYGIWVRARNGTLSTATITDNLIQQAGRHSVLIQTSSAADNICIAQFTGNTSSMPNAFGGGGNDMNFNLAVGSTVNFVNFANVSLNNTGFDDIIGTPTGTPASCP
ncbi:MAG: hypothetical protein AAGA60_10265 [Cyanobacteria bacterium P01_E01_bin.42]